MYVVVTGAAGFIGSNLVKALNARGETDIIAVDNLAQADKFRNLVDCDIADYLDKEDFLARVVNGDFDDDIAAVFHEGACSDTTASDGRYMLANNYRYSVTLLEHCQDNDIPFLYASSASVYGAGTVFREERAHEAPLNVYGYSKALFDQYVRRLLPERTAPIAGFRYFNVYGPREAHKGRMASVAYHFFQQYRRDGRVRLFAGLRRISGRRAAARFHPCRRRRRGESRLLRSWRALGHLQPRHRQCGDVQRRRARDDQRVPQRCAGDPPRAFNELTRRRDDHVRSDARGAPWQVPELHAGGSHASSRGGLRGADARRSGRACRATSKV